MSTTHVYDAHCDEMEAELKRQGAKEALESLLHEMTLSIVAAHNVGQEELLSGLLHAKKEISKALATAEGGAA